MPTVPPAPDGDVSKRARAPGLHEAPTTDDVKRGRTQGEGDKDASPLLLRATDPNNRAQGRC
jgi:hypothetical protein